MTKPRKPQDDDVEVEGEQTQIFDSNKNPILDRRFAVPVPRAREPAPDEPRPTRPIVAQQPPASAPAPSPSPNVRRKPITAVPAGSASGVANPSAPVRTAGSGPRATVPREPRESRPTREPVPGGSDRFPEQPTVIRPTGPSAPTGPRPTPRPTPSVIPRASGLIGKAVAVLEAKTIIDDGDHDDPAVTAPNLKLPADMMSADSSNDMRAFDAPTRVALPPEALDSDGLDGVIATISETPAPDLMVDTNPVGRAAPPKPAHRRSTQPMMLPDATKIGVIAYPAAAERPSLPRVAQPQPAPLVPQLMVAQPLPPALLAPQPPPAPSPSPPASDARAVPRRLDKYTPTSMHAVDADGAPARDLPERVRAVTPTAMHSEPPPSASMGARFDEEDDDNFHETRERKIDRALLASLPAAARAIALGGGAPSPDDSKQETARQPAKDSKPRPAVLMGPPTDNKAHPGKPATAPISAARPVAPKGTPIVWMILASLAIATAVATAMWFLLGDGTTPW